jgi:peptidoglycan/xylan/chitin deacetylase (PgdA/CDA1 family)
MESPDQQPSERLASVSVDLDTLPHYMRIHGLSESLLTDAMRERIYSTALPRLMTLFDAHRITPTLFVIGEDLAQPMAQGILQAVHRAGTELANHSHRHLYELARVPAAQVEQEIANADEALFQLTGERPVGFRAPGYALSPEILQSLAKRGYLYDSSVFPAIPYYLAKASVMGAMWLTRRRSGAQLDRPSILLAPRIPYRASLEAPYRRAQGPTGLLELPISVSPRTRTPFFGTGITTMSNWASEVLYGSLRRDVLVNLELHAIDLLDATDGLPPELVKKQPGLGVSVLDKTQRLGQVFRWIKGDRTCVTLREAAQRLATTFPS